MSIEAFVKHGSARRQIGDKNGGVYGPIQLFDIGEENCVGAKYADGSCQAHPLGWYPRTVADALKQSQTTAQRARLPEAVPVSNGRPRLNPVRPARPTLPQFPPAELEAAAKARPRLKLKAKR